MFEEGVVDRPPLSPLRPAGAPRMRCHRQGLCSRGSFGNACYVRAPAACASASHTHARARERERARVSCTRAEIRPGADADATATSGGASRWLKGRMNGWMERERDVCVCHCDFKIATPNRYTVRPYPSLMLHLYLRGSSPFSPGVAVPMTAGECARLP